MKNKNSLLNPENSVTHETSQIPDKLSFNNEISPLCPSSCKTCNSIYTSEIHELRLRKNEKFREISTILLKKYNFSISAGALCRHFKNYNQHIKNLSNQTLIKWTNSQVDFRSKHMSQLDDMINSMFEKLATNWGTVSPSIDSLTQLMKLRYQVVEGKIDPDSFDEQVRILIQNAENINNVASQSRLNLNQPIEVPKAPARK